MMHALGWRRPAAAAAGFALLAAAGAGCGRSAPAAPQNGAQPAGVAVTVAPAVRQDITHAVDVTGSLAALEDVVLGARMPGRIAEVRKHAGDPVSAGEVVAVVNPADWREQVRQAQAAVEAALTRDDQARSALVQARALLSASETGLALTRRTTETVASAASDGLATAQERLAIVRQGARAQERAQAEDQVRVAQAAHDRARSDLRRFQALFREQAVSQSHLDQAQAGFDAAQAQLSIAQQALSLVREGARPEEVRQAELAVSAARAQRDRAEADRDQVRIREMDVQTARANVASAEAGARAAQAGVVQARASLTIAQAALNDAFVRSPISGYVAQRMAEPGQQVGGGGAILRVVAPGSVYFRAILSESQFAEVRLGQRTTVTVDAIAGLKLRGTVARILPVASVAARSFTVRIDIEEDRRLRPEMFARGSIVIDTRRGATLVPKDAVLHDPANNRTRVFVEDGGRARERVVALGHSNPLQVEVVSGVRPGEKVIVAGQDALTDGDEVTVR
ncbi:MAG TPA: efflux RND transporter periplasmic adaptor subunit [Chthonomonadales bacterium]|nr:efflux RND transporter periplasmic adaptor subunit [Chthonomonadales bacterium]